MNMKKEPVGLFQSSALLTCALGLFLASACQAIDIGSGQTYVRLDIGNGAVLGFFEDGSSETYRETEALEDFVTVKPGGELNVFPGSSAWGVSAEATTDSDSRVSFYGGSLLSALHIQSEYVVTTVYGKDFVLSNAVGANIDEPPTQITVLDPVAGGAGKLTWEYLENAYSLDFDSKADISLESPVGNVTEIDIDIKARSYPNSVNLGSNGVVPVAILSDPETEFDATSIAPETVFLAGAGVAVRGKGGKNTLASHEDVNGDGELDLVLKIETENLDPGTFQDGMAVLRVHETDDPSSPVVYEGWDEINIVPPVPPTE